MQPNFTKQWTTKAMETKVYFQIVNHRNPVSFVHHTTDNTITTTSQWQWHNNQYSLPLMEMKKRVLELNSSLTLWPNIRWKLCRCKLSYLLISTDLSHLSYSFVKQHHMNYHYKNPHKLELNSNCLIKQYTMTMLYWTYYSSFITKG